MFGTSQLKRAAQSLLVAAALVACGSGSQQGKSYAFTLLGESDPGEPLAAVQLLRNGKALAETNADGVAQLSLIGNEGQRLAVTAGCPVGTTPYERELTTTLRTYESARTPELLVRCAPNERELTVVAMLERGANLPIQHRLRTLAVTDNDGVAHFALHGKPGETFELTINTDQQPGLRPANPGVSLTIGGRDDAQVLERSFIAPKEKPKPRARGPVLPKKIR
jgi:hypothetical protein